MLCPPTSSAAIPVGTAGRSEGVEGNGEAEDSTCDVANMTLTQGPSTVNYAFTYSDTMFVLSYCSSLHLSQANNLNSSLSLNCKLGGTTSASCIFAQSQSGGAFTTSASLEGSEVAAAFAPVTLIGNVKGSAVTAASGGSVGSGIASKTGSGGVLATGTSSVLASSGAGNSTMTSGTTRIGGFEEMVFVGVGMAMSALY
jgi:hypothetical protein